MRAQKIDHHPNRNRGEDNRRQRIKPDSIWPRNLGTSRAKHDDPEHGEQRADQQAELDVTDDALKTFRQQEQIYDQQLQNDGVRRHPLLVLTAEQAKQPMVFTHRHRYSRADPCHRADRRDQTQANDRADNPAAAGAKNVFTRD